YHLHANVARFTRPLAKNSRTFVNKDEKLQGNSNGTKTDSAERDSHNSYAYVVKGGSQVIGEKDNNPVLVLDDSCVNQQEFSWCLNGKVKEFDRFLSDHRPILLRESDHDFGPIPFQFFHYWLEVEMFKKLIIDFWHEAPGHSSNAMINFMQKLKFVK
nr:RNA-directed DNA polymerase, eukaryota, reverse transcriptase zinc-binding domain protein [Tanacetum cinerariifolium]